MTLVAGAALTAVYVLAVGSATWWDVLAGAAISLVLLMRFTGFVVPHPGRDARRHSLARAGPALRLLVVVVWELAVGAVTVLRAALGGHHRPGLVEVPIKERSENQVKLAAFLATLAPDEFLVEVDWSRRVMVFHVIDASDADGIRRRHDRLYEKYIAPLFA